MVNVHIIRVTLHSTQNVLSKIINYCNAVSWTLNIVTAVGIVRDTFTTEINEVYPITIRSGNIVTHIRNIIDVTHDNTIRSKNIQVISKLKRSNKVDYTKLK